MATYLGAFPFPSLAPAILTREAMVKVVVMMMTGRYGKVLKKGQKDRNKLLFRSLGKCFFQQEPGLLMFLLAVYDRQFDSKIMAEKPGSVGRSGEDQAKELNAHTEKTAGFAMDKPGIDDNDDDDDELALAALDTLDVMDIYKTEHASEYKAQQAQIPVENFRQLLLLLLVLAPLGAEEPLSSLINSVTESRTEALRRVADSILRSFAPERNPGIDFHTFIKVVDYSLPFLFEGLNPLFERFLFSKNLAHNQPRILESQLEPLLEAGGEILDITTLSQISFFLPATSLFRRLRLLYSGASAGYSINSISQKVINWRVPSILLVSGRRLDLDHSSHHERSFTDSLPYRSLPRSSQRDLKEQRLVFGAYINVPWKQTQKEAFGDSQTTLFQLEPVHDVFHASTINRDYVTFNLSTGIGLGCPPAKSSLGMSSGHAMVLGPVSLHLNSTLEYGVFTHDDLGGGAFGTSRARSGSWRDMFEIDSLEVWGCGGDEAAAEQRKAWKWEEREAAARRGIALGMDKDATYALLEMAGIVGGSSRSGGSIQ